MATTPDHPITALPGRPPVVDLAAWQTARDKLLVREKAHTPGDALAAARRRLPWWRSTGRSRSSDPTGRSRSSTCSQGRNELVVYRHMWYDGRRTRVSARAARPRPGT